MPVMIGLDTGGTYTDAVAFDDDRGVVAKMLTTGRDLSLGIAAAVDAVLAEAAVDPAEVTLVSMSTTLAINAIVEGHGGRICLVLIGMADCDLDQAGLWQSLKDDEVIFLAGGHDAHGAEVQPLDTAPLRERLAAGSMAVTGFAVAGLFAARNPTHEQAVAREIREATDLGVTCSTELSAKLNAPRRALTSVLNARLIGLIRHLIVAAETLLDARSITAPLMVVRGDGALISAAVAKEKPIETILSGPAASLVGAAQLTGLKDAVVSDIGGTTTDIAVLRDGRPHLDPLGATVGGWRTMVEAVAMRTVGLGGDSEVHLDASGLARRLTLGPRKVAPVSLLAAEHGDIVHRALDRQLQADPPPERAGRFALSILRGDAELASFDDMERALLDAMADGPAPLDKLIQGRGDARALARLASAGAAMIAAFSPSDAAHVLGLHDDWDGEAAAKAAALFARRKTGRGLAAARDAGEISRAVIDALTRTTAETLLEAGFHEDGFEAPGLSAHILAQSAFDRWSGLVDLTVRLGRPIVGLATGGAGVKINRLAGGSQPKVTLPKNAGGDDEFDQSA